MPLRRPFDVAENVFDETLGAFERTPGDILQRQAAQRQGYAAADAAAFDVNKFERTAAEIADDAVRLVNAGDDTERSELRFPRPRQHADANPTDALGFADEVAAIAGVAARGSRDRPQLPHVQRVAQSAEAAQRLERFGNGFRREQAGRLHLAAEARQHLFVEDRREAPRQAFVDDEAHRVGADIDDGDRRPVIEPALHRGMHDVCGATTRFRGGGGDCAAIL